MSRMFARNLLVGLLALIISSYSYLPSQNSGIKSDKKENICESKITVLTFECTDDESVITDDTIEASMEVFRTKLTSLGYPEAIVSKQDGNKIVVKIPDADLDDIALEHLGESAKLTFTDYEGSVVLDGNDIKSAKAEYGRVSDGENGHKLVIAFTDEGTKKFSEATKRISELADPNNIIRIAIDDAIISAPRVFQQITDSECYIEGDFTKEEVRIFASQIQGGILPLSFELIETKTN